MARCIFCGIIMSVYDEGNICDCCLDDLYESDPGEEVNKD